MAQLLAYRLTRHSILPEGTNIIVVSFGSPRLGGPAFADAFNAMTNVINYRVVNDADPVPRVPSFNFKHAGILIHVRPPEDWATGAGNVHVYRDGADVPSPCTNCICANIDGGDHAVARYTPPKRLHGNTRDSESESRPCLSFLNCADCGGGTLGGRSAASTASAIAAVADSRGHRAERSATAGKEDGRPSGGSEPEAASEAGSVASVVAVSEASRHERKTRAKDDASASSASIDDPACFTGYLYSVASVPADKWPNSGPPWCGVSAADFIVAPRGYTGRMFVFTEVEKSSIMDATESDLSDNGEGGKAGARAGGSAPHLVKRRTLAWGVGLDDKWLEAAQSESDIATKRPPVQQAPMTS